MTDQCAPNAFFAPIAPTEVRLGWFGLDGQWAVAEGHLDPAAFVEVVNGTYDPPAVLDPAGVIHAHAVLVVDVSLPEDHDLRVCIRWNGITADTENAFPVTAIDTTA